MDINALFENVTPEDLQRMLATGWPRRCFERLGDAGTRGIAGANWSCLSSRGVASVAALGYRGGVAGRGSARDVFSGEYLLCQGTPVGPERPTCATPPKSFWLNAEG